MSSKMRLRDVVTPHTLIPLSVAGALAAGIVGLVPLGISYGAERAALVARVSELERADGERERRIEALGERLGAMERSLWRIEGKLGTLPEKESMKDEGRRMK